jgi:hypothetical protein
MELAILDLALDELVDDVDNLKADLGLLMPPLQANQT